MNSRLYFLILATFFGLFSRNGHSQIAAASLFKEMRAQNPAVISQRPAGTFSALLKKDMVEKEQSNTSGATVATSDIDITSAMFFYGGKGGGLTSEISGELATGTKDDSVNNLGASSTVKNEADMTVLTANFGFYDFLGFGVMNVTEERTQTGDNSNGSYSTSVTAFNLGFNIDFGLNIGLFYQPTTLTQEGTFDGDPTNMEIDMPRAGIGIGKSTKNFHFELGYVTDLEDMAVDQGGGSGPGSNAVTYKPSKYFVAIEFKLKKLMLGLSSNYYMDGFFDFNNLMYYTMVLANNRENRLENTINFSLGGDKGSSFSGSVTYSTVESQEGLPNLLDGQKYKTVSTIKGAQVSYTYNF